MKNVKFIVFVFILLCIPSYIIYKTGSELFLTYATVKRQTYNVITIEPGNIQTSYYSLGDQVYANQLMFVISSPGLISQLNQLKDSLVVLNQAFNTDSNEIKKQILHSQQLLASEKKQLLKYQSFSTSGAVSLMMMDNALVNYNQVKLQYENSQLQLSDLIDKHNTRSSAINLQIIDVSNRIKNLSINAQEGGVISSINVLPGSMVISGTVLATIDKGNIIEVNDDVLLKSNVSLLYNFHKYKCSATNVSGIDNSVQIFQQNKKSHYILNCPKLSNNFSDGKRFIVW